MEVASPLLMLSFIQGSIFPLICWPLLAIYLELFITKRSLAMIKISQRESRSTGKDCSTLPCSERLQPPSILSDILIYQTSQVEVSQWKQKSKRISVADVHSVTKHMNFTLQKQTSLSSWAQTVSFRYFSGFICCHIGKLRQSGLGDTPSRDGTRGI